MNSPIGNYRKYKWFLTSTKKLVVGGKSAEQNDELLKFLKSKSEDYIVMHTHAPGSPFSVILAPTEEVKKEDMEETAIFTASFSRAWKLNKKKAIIDIFKLSSLNKTKTMKTGTWGVKEKLSSKTVPLELVLTKQNNILRAVPEKSTKTFFLKIKPGNIDKIKIIPEIQKNIPKSNPEEILQALPSGTIQIIK